MYISNNKGADIQLNSTVQNSNNIDIKKILMNINYSFKANVIYQIELSTPTQYLINVNNVSILSSDNTCSFKQITDANIGFPKIRFTCPYDTSYVTIGLSNLSDNNITSSYNFRWNYTYLSIVNENVVNLNPVLDGQAGINDNITNSTNTITGSINETEDNLNSSIQSSQDNINQNINDMEQSIVDSNKENTDKEIESQKVCKNYNFNINNVKKIDGYLSSNGNIYDGGSGFKHTDFIPLNKNENYTLSINFNNNNLAYCLYTKDKTLISCEKYNIKQTFTINLSEDGYIRYSTRETYDVNFTGKYCENGNQALNDKLDEQNDKLDGIQGALTDSSAPNTSGLENSAGWLPAGPLDSILNLPLTMLNSLTNSLGKTCAPLNLKLPYVNKNIQIPCLSAIFAQITGVNGLWTWVGTITSVLILYNYLLNLYAWVDRVLTLRAEFDEAMGADMANWGRL